MQKNKKALGEFKSVIATLERLTALYPTNIDLKLYLLSIAVKTDSTEKVLRLIDEIRQSDEITEDVKTRVAQVFDDINKKRIDDEKAIARQKARQVVEEEEKKRSQVASKESSWTFYQDIGWKVALHSNIGNVSTSKTQHSAGSVVAMSGVEGDNTETINTLTGVIYQINDTSNISFQLVHLHQNKTEVQLMKMIQIHFHLVTVNFLRKTLLALPTLLPTLTLEEQQILMQTI